VDDLEVAPDIVYASVTEDAQLSPKVALGITTDLSQTPEAVKSEIFEDAATVGFSLSRTVTVIEAEAVLLAASVAV